MAFAFAGRRYKLHSSDKFDELMVAIGTDEQLRKLGNTATPIVEVVQNGDTYTIKTLTDARNNEVSFKSGVEFDQTLYDGSKAKTIIKVEGNKITEEQKGKNHLIVVREFSADELKVVTTGGGVTATRIYKPE